MRRPTWQVLSVWGRDPSGDRSSRRVSGERQTKQRCDVGTAWWLPRDGAWIVEATSLVDLST
jgi:hypothetical protein